MLHEMTTTTTTKETTEPADAGLLYDPTHPILQELPKVEARLKKLNEGVVSLALNPDARLHVEAAALERRRLRNEALTDAMAAAK